MDMKEKREMIQGVLEFLAYKIRAGEITTPGGDVIYKIILANPQLANQIEYILEMDLPENDTIAKIQRLVPQQ